MSGPNDPIPQEAIDKVVAGGSITTDDQAGFVDGAEAVPAVATDPATPKTDVTLAASLPEEPASKLARLEAFVQEELVAAGALVDADQDVVDLVIGLVRNAVVIPGRLGGSVLPMVCEDPEGRVESITVVASVSGGADESEGMPRTLSLARVLRGGETRRANYAQAPGSVEVTDG